MNEKVKKISLVKVTCVLPRATSDLLYLTVNGNTVGAN